MKTFAVLKGTCNRDITRGGTIEALAIAIHEYHCRTRGVDLTSETNRCHRWNELTEDSKEDNRRAAVYIGVKLHAIGCEIQPLDALKNSGSASLTDTDLEKLAKLEHERWMVQKLRDGWSYGEGGNDGNKKNSYLRPWGELKPEQKKSSLQRESDLPQILALANYGIRRMGSDEPSERRAVSVV